MASPVHPARRAEIGLGRVHSVHTSGKDFDVVSGKEPETGPQVQAKRHGKEGKDKDRAVGIVVAAVDVAIGVEVDTVDS